MSSNAMKSKNWKQVLLMQACLYACARKGGRGVFCVQEGRRLGICKVDHVTGSTPEVLFTCNLVPGTRKYGACAFAPLLH